MSKTGKLIETMCYVNTPTGGACDEVKLYEPIERGTTYHALLIDSRTTYRERLEILAKLFVSMTSTISKNKDLDNPGMMDTGLNPQFTFFFIQLSYLLGYVLNCTSYKNQKPEGVADFDLPELDKRVSRLNFTSK